MACNLSYCSSPKNFILKPYLERQDKSDDARFPVQKDELESAFRNVFIKLDSLIGKMDAVVISNALFLSSHANEKLTRYYHRAQQIVVEIKLLRKRLLEDKTDEVIVLSAKEHKTIYGQIEAWFRTNLWKRFIDVYQDLMLSKISYLKLQQQNIITEMNEKKASLIPPQLEAYHNQMTEIDLRFSEIRNSTKTEHLKTNNEKAKYNGELTDFDDFRIQYENILHYLELAHVVIGTIIVDYPGRRKSSSSSTNTKTT